MALGLWSRSSTWVSSQVSFVELQSCVGTGGICAMVWDPHSPLAGCAAGCWALIFVHAAELGRL